MCDNRITKRYKGIDEEGQSAVNTQISSDEVIIRMTGEEGWNIEFDKEPTKVNSCGYFISTHNNYSSTDFEEGYSSP